MAVVPTDYLKSHPAMKQEAQPFTVEQSAREYNKEDDPKSSLWSRLWWMTVVLTDYLKSHPATKQESQP